MPLPLEYSDRPHWALMWPVTDEIDEQGQRVVDDAYQILRVRWEERIVEETGQAGTTRSRQATVIVDRDIAPGSRMWKGKEVDWLGTGSGDEGSRDSELMEVMYANDYTDLRGRLVKRTVVCRAARLSP